MICFGFMIAGITVGWVLDTGGKDFHRDCQALRRSILISSSGLNGLLI